MGHRQACADAAALSHGSDIRLSINVSARELANPDFVAIVEAALLKNAIDGSRLEVELTELTLSQRFAEAKHKLPLLAALGLTIAVDGYGAGRSSILELAELPIHTLKLHASFLAEIDAKRRHAPLAAIVGVAAALGWCVVGDARRDSGAARHGTTPGLPTRPGPLLGHHGARPTDVRGALLAV